MELDLVRLFTGLTATLLAGGVLGLFRMSRALAELTTALRAINRRLDDYEERIKWLERNE